MVIQEGDHVFPLYYYWWNSNVTVVGWFICSDRNQGWSLSFFLTSLFCFLWKDNKMRTWVETTTPGQKGQTRGPALPRVARTYVRRPRTQSDVFSRTSADWTRTWGGEHTPRNTWKGYEHVIYWYRRRNIRFNRTMLMSLIFWISSTGAWQTPSPMNPSDTMFG